MSCGSSDISEEICTYCGAVVVAKSLADLNKVDQSSLNLFKVNSDTSSLDNLTHDDMSSAFLTQILVMLKRGQWNDAIAISSKARLKIPQAIEFMEYHLVSLIAGNELRHLNLNEVRDIVSTLHKVDAKNERGKNLCGYLINCVNIIWSEPNKLRFFEHEAWESDDEVTAVSQFFDDERLIRAGLIFEEPGKAKVVILPKHVKLKEKIFTIVKQTDEEIQEMYKVYKIEQDQLLELINKEQNQVTIDAILELFNSLENRSEKYFLEATGQDSGSDPDSPFSTLQRAILAKVPTVPMFGGKLSSKFVGRIRYKIEDEQKLIEKSSTFLS